MYYDAILDAVISQTRNLFPNQIPVGIDRPTAGSITFPANCATIVCERQGFPQLAPGNQLRGGAGSFVANLATLANQIRAGLAFSLPAQNLPTPFAQQWHATIEHDSNSQTVVAVGYVGTRGQRRTRITTPNLGPNNTPLVQAGTGTYISSPGPVTTSALLVDTASLLLPDRPNANIGSYQIFENAAASSYHALLIEATRRYNKQLNFTAAYTWSHALDEVSDIFPLSGALVVAQNQRHPRNERGNAHFDLRHRVSASAIWEIPKSRGWQLAAIAQAQTGQPFTITLPIDANLDGNLSDRPATLQGLQIVKGQRERMRLASGATLNDFIVAGQDGVIGRNTLRGAGFVNVAVALAKTLRRWGESNLQFRAEDFNLFNRAYFGLPVRTLDAPGFGSAVATVTPARRLQVALQFQF